LGYRVPKDRHIHGVYNGILRTSKLRSEDFQTVIANVVYGGKEHYAYLENEEKYAAVNYSSYKKKKENLLKKHWKD
jgi:hypothetical protein